MKIVKSCDEQKQPSGIAPTMIPSGTVFRCGGHEYGPYMKVGNHQAVDLNTGAIMPLMPKVTNYKPLPNAKLVTGEV